MVTYVLIYLAAVVLKVLGFPLVREIKWKWFVLVPLFYVLYQVFGKVIVWLLYLLVGLGILYGIAELGMWLYR